MWHEVESSIRLCHSMVMRHLLLNLCRLSFSTQQVFSVLWGILLASCGHHATIPDKVVMNGDTLHRRVTVIRKFTSAAAGHSHQTEKVDTIVYYDFNGRPALERLGGKYVVREIRYKYLGDTILIEKEDDDGICCDTLFTRQRHVVYAKSGEYKYKGNKARDDEDEERRAGFAEYDFTYDNGRLVSMGDIPPAGQLCPGRSEYYFKQKCNS